MILRCASYRFVSNTKRCLFLQDALRVKLRIWVMCGLHAGIDFISLINSRVRENKHTSRLVIRRNALFALQIFRDLRDILRNLGNSRKLFILEFTKSVAMVSW